MTTNETINPESTTLQQVKRRERLARTVLEKIRDRNISEPREGPTFSISQAAELVNRSASAIRMAEAEGRLPEQTRKQLKQRENYTIEQLNNMRRVFGTRPWRSPEDPPIILPVQNFKGGVGKSTTSLHLAQYLAIHGYRVLLIDADAQASATMMFGYIPDSDLGVFDSLYACLIPGDEEERPIQDLIRKTHYDGLDLIPANLHLYNAEYEIASRMPSFGPTMLTVLQSQIAKIADNYDVVVIDPPPALGMISLSVLYAANALVIPMPPNTIDFASTTAFFSMLAQTMETLEKAELQADYGFIQLVISRSDENKVAQREIIDLTQMVFGRTVMETEMKNSAEIDNCTARQLSVYDMTTGATGSKTRKRCLQQLNSLNMEIEKHIRSLWPNSPPIDRAGPTWASRPLAPNQL